MTDPLAFASYEPNRSASAATSVSQGDPAALMRNLSALLESPAVRDMLERSRRDRRDMWTAYSRRRR